MTEDHIPSPTSPAWHRMSHAVKNWGTRSLPTSVVERLATMWDQNPRRRLLRRHAQARNSRISRAVLRGQPAVVVTGPFAGMRYIDEAYGSAYWPKVLGSYESALHEPLEHLIERGPRTVIDVGSAEGYYAVGLARRLPEAIVIAIDVDRRARELCRRLAQLNEVDQRVAVRGEVDATELDALLEPGCLLIMDVEGAELTLLRPDKMPNLASADIVVELHDFVDRTITTVVLDRLAPTHLVTVIDEAHLSPERVRESLDLLSVADAQHALSEYRPERMRWAVCSPHL